MYGHPFFQNGECMESCIVGNLHKYSMYVGKMCPRKNIGILKNSLVDQYHKMTLFEKNTNLFGIFAFIIYII